jgi:PAS domain S-box-containing protein
VQTAVEVAEERGRHWGLALSLVLTRVLPALDRLTDAIARGYWVAVMRRQNENQARYANVVQQAFDGVYEITPERHISYANAALGVILGRSVDELLGASLVDVLGTATGQSFDQELAQVAVQRPDGVVRILEIRTVERHVDGVLAGYDGVVRDLTAAVQAEQLRNDFLALLGSELRQPLTTVLGLGATLEEHGDELGTDRVRVVGEKVRHQVERMARLADDLFEISRLELGSLVLSPRAVALRPVISHALDAMGDDLDQSALAVHVSDDLSVIADPRRLEQVIVNLAENALRFGASPVEIRAAATTVGRSVEIEVHDHGAGVDPSLVPTLFSELRHLTGRPRRRPADGGLGLALVRGLVEAMGGRVRYEAGADGGATFIVTLPRA